MTLSDLASIGSFVSGVAVLVSLVFLYFQLRQVTEQVKQAETNQRAAIRANRATRILDMQLAIAAEPSLSDAVSLGISADESISDTQLRQFSQWSIGRFYSAEDSFFQHKQGLLDDIAFGDLARGLRIHMSMPGMRVAYRAIGRRWLNEEFVAFVDAMVADTPEELPKLDAAWWRANFAAERTQLERPTRS